MRKTKSGFTIVELLIVIVIIGILAAITIVAYNGIQQRAQNAGIISGVNIYHKGILAYSVLNQRYPYGATSNLCLGSGYIDGVCVKGPMVGGQTISSPDTTFDSSMAAVMQSKPNIGGRLVDLTGGNYAVGAYLWYRYIFYLLYGNDQNCAAGGTGSNYGPMTLCTITLPDPAKL